MIGKFHLVFTSSYIGGIDISFLKRVSMRFLIFKDNKDLLRSEIYAYDWLDRSVVKDRYSLNNTTYWSHSFNPYESIKNLQKKNRS